MSLKQPKVIVSLDFSIQQGVLEFARSLDPKKYILQVGTELFTSLGIEFISILIDENYEIFLDLKYYENHYDIGKVMVAAAGLGVSLISINALGGSKMIKSAVDSLKGIRNRPLLIASPVLSSMDSDDFIEMGIDLRIDKLSVSLTNLAFNLGVDGVFCSAWEIENIKKTCSKDFITIVSCCTYSSCENAFEKRISTVENAIEKGSDYYLIDDKITSSLNFYKL